MNKIKWMGNEYTHSSSREGHVPFVIVDHISAGTMASMDSWFQSSGNEISSAHFGVAKDGRIHQYVAIERMAWAQGLKASTIQFAKAQVVHDIGINPNLYCVGVEHEGLDGDLTEEQFQASVWLHFYIQKYIEEHYGRKFPLDEYHVIGHFQVDPIRKPFCPGPHFPWEQLYERLRGDDEVELRKEIEQLKEQVEKLEAHQSMKAPLWAAEAIATAVRANIVDTPDGGSYDFYRFITVLYRLNLLKGGK